MNKLGLLTIMFCFLMVACQEKPVEDAVEQQVQIQAQSAQEAVIEAIQSLEPVELIATINELRVRDEAGLKLSLIHI